MLPILKQNIYPWSQDRSADSDTAGAGADLSLVVMVWEVEDPEAGERTAYMGLWDINCWYQVTQTSLI